MRISAIVRIHQRPVALAPAPGKFEPRRLSGTRIKLDIVIGVSWKPAVSWANTYAAGATGQMNVVQCERGTMI
jgi:hypothetical protein